MVLFVELAPASSTLPNEPVEVDEPLMFPSLETMFPSETVKPLVA